MLEAIMSVLTGGATGLLGTAMSAAIDFFQSRAEHKREVDLRRLDIELAKTEAGSAERVAAIEAEGARGRAELEAMEASYREASSRMSRAVDGFLMKFVDFVRGMTRPVLTWGLVALVGTIYFTLAAGDLAPESTKPRIIETILYLATAAVLWWFGQRQIEKRRVKGLPWLK
ncbi:MAG: hypothetical protein OXK73_12310 [Rhodospirillaceae bacterium]|nr:hypothetical protein [Rhodospirillaceae bacterium]